MAELDALAGLYNRRSFNIIAHSIFADGEALSEDIAVMIIDVDYFKTYNDFYGHQAGDKCLVQVAGLLDQLLTQDDVTVERCGGEEFIVLVAGDAVSAVEELAAKIQEALAGESIEHQKSTVADRVTVSIGVACAKDEGSRLDDLISRADEALCEAKASARTCTVLSSKNLRDRIREDRNAALSVFRAIELEALEPFFQPQNDASTEALVGVEALVRRRFRDGTFQSPAEFIQVASFHGYLVDIDRIILKEVRDFLNTALDAQIAIARLSVNAPRDNLLDKDYIRDVTDLSAAFPTQLVLELLKTAMLDDPDDVLRWQLDSLRDQGIDIEIDDFGTGHTSVIRLMNLKPLRIKIAKDLVLPIADDETFDRVVQSVIQISIALGVEVLAEGVETKALSDRLIEQGCPIQRVSTLLTR